MRLIILSVLAVLLSGGLAEADRRGRGRDWERRPVVRDHRDHRRPVVRDHRYSRPRYTGPIRANRRVIDRRPLYVSNGRFRFHNGRTVVYRRPVIRQRYYDVRIRPQIIVESYPPMYGYVWVNGRWEWNGTEWIWMSGHYAPDPTITVYYDDGSWE